MTTLEHLQAVRELLTPPERWTQGAWARDAEGNAVPSDDENAVCFCFDGAIEAVRRRLGGFPAAAYQALLRAAGIMSGDASLMGFNDAPDCEHDDVLSVINLAIDRAVDAERASGGGS